MCAIPYTFTLGGWMGRQMVFFVVLFSSGRLPNVRANAT
jgi:hypothetical protein